MKSIILSIFEVKQHSKIADTLRWSDGARSSSMNVYRYVSFNFLCSPPLLRFLLALRWHGFGHDFIYVCFDFWYLRFFMMNKTDLRKIAELDPKSAHSSKLDVARGHGTTSPVVQSQHRRNWKAAVCSLRCEAFAPQTAKSQCEAPLYVPLHHLERPPVWLDGMWWLLSTMWHSVS